MTHRHPLRDGCLLICITGPNLGPPCLQILPPCRGDSCPEHGARNLHVRPIEGVHGGLDPVLVDLGEEVADGLLGGGGGRVRGDRGGADGGGGGGGLVQEEELGVGRGYVGGDVIVEEAVNVLEVPERGGLVSVVEDGIVAFALRTSL